ncbi:MAG: SGNH/GDSL hydrolase family protein [Planctomycetota bacterium]|nr:SGNH/GDSL hydrolase family protein [Planctomycetota bacterium]
MPHVVLLGDSIFDNAAYVPGEPDVIAQLRRALPSAWQATLCAVDGSVIADVISQCRSLPTDATHLVVSAGGNDALGHAGLLSETASSVAEALGKLAGASARFERDYRAMLQHVLARKLPTAVCAIYYPRFPETRAQRLAVAALTHFNDCIIKLASQAGVPLLDLRLICNEDSDYANPIEPSAAGGEKICTAIVRMLKDHDFTRRRTEVYVR